MLLRRRCRRAARDRARLRLSGWGLILLGVAYALVEEGLALLLVSLADRVEDVLFQMIMIGGVVVGYEWVRRRISAAG